MLNYNLPRFSTRLSQVKIRQYVFSIVLCQQCFDEYFVKFNFFDVPCFKSSLSKALGVGIIAGSLLVKVPQILKILNNKSGEVLLVSFRSVHGAMVHSWEFKQ
ncbi:uncharacterized protein CBL_05997 [Carabus blaptoides fortunei]